MLTSSTPRHTRRKFDKRDYMDKPPPRNLQQPPANVDNILVRLIIAMINEATSTIPCWDEYATTKKVTTTCGATSIAVEYKAAGQR